MGSGFATGFIIGEIFGGFVVIVGFIYKDRREKLKIKRNRT